MKTFVVATALALAALPSLAQPASAASHYPQQDRVGREAALPAPVVEAGATVAYYPHVDRSGDVAVLDRAAAAPADQAVAVSYYPHVDRVGDTFQAQPAVPATTLTRAVRGGASS